jgi:rod shape-determining protein MreC
MLTSGSGGLYRPGIAVAVVTELTRDGAYARVLSDPSSSEFVAVERPLAASLGMPDPDKVAPAVANPPPAKH